MKIKLYYMHREMIINIIIMIVIKLWQILYYRIKIELLDLYQQKNISNGYKKEDWVYQLLIHFIIKK